MRTGPHEEYRHSGQVDSGRFPIASFGTLLICAAIGAAYGFVDAYIPFVKIHVLVTFVAGLAAGGLVGGLFRAMRMRSLPMALLLTLAGQAAGYYLCWCTWIYAMHFFRDVTVLELAKAPGPLYDAILKINEVGAWTIDKGSAVSGVPLWIVWGTEAAILFITPLVMVWKALSGGLYCEACDRWAAKAGAPVQLAPAGSGMRESFLAGDFAAVEKAGLPTTNTRFTTLTFHACPACADTCSVTAAETTLTQVKGKWKKAEKAVVDRLLVTEEEATYLRRIPERLRAAEKAALEAAAKVKEAGAKPSRNP